MLPDAHAGGTVLGIRSLCLLFTLSALGCTRSADQDGDDTDDVDDVTPAESLITSESYHWSCGEFGGLSGDVSLQFLEGGAGTQCKIEGPLAGCTPMVWSVGSATDTIDISGGYATRLSQIAPNAELDPTYFSAKITRSEGTNDIACSLASGGL